MISREGCIHGFGVLDLFVLVMLSSILYFLLISRFILVRSDRRRCRFHDIWRFLISGEARNSRLWSFKFVNIFKSYINTMFYRILLVIVRRLMPCDVAAPCYIIFGQSSVPSLPHTLVSRLYPFVLPRTFRCSRSSLRFAQSVLTLAD